MKQQLVFGTYNVPPLTENSLSASFTAPSNVPKEMIKGIIYSEDQKTETPNTANFDAVLKGVLSVPKPA